MKPVLLLCFALLEITAEPLCPKTNMWDPVFLPDEDCSKFWECIYGTPHLLHCPAGLHFNPKSNLCEWPDSSVCDSIKEKNQKPKSIEPPITTPKPFSDSGNKDAKAVPICSDYANPNLHIAAGECSKFWICYKGHISLQSCPSGLHFNRVLQVCDWPKSAGCKSRTESNTLEPINTTPQPDRVTDDTDVINICSDETNSNALYVDDRDCSKFWQCSNGKLYKHSCPSGLYFNRVSLICDWPANVVCTPTDLSTLKPVTPTPKPVTDSDDTNHSSDAVPICSDGTNGFYVANGECTKFWQCYNGQLTEQSCPSGLHFNRVLKVCDWPENGGCEIGTDKTTASPSDAEEETGEPDFSTEEPFSNYVTKVLPTDTLPPRTASTTTAPITTSTPEPTTITCTTNHTSTKTTSTNTITAEPTTTTTTATPAPTTSVPPTTTTPETPSTTTTKISVPTTTTITPEHTTTTTPAQTTTAPTTINTPEPSTTTTTTSPEPSTSTTPAPKKTAPTTVASSTTIATTESSITKVKPRNIPLSDESDEKVEPKNLESSEEYEEDIDTICQKFDTIKLLPYPGDCRKFITCVRRQARARDCPMNQYFTPSRNACTSDRSACRNIILNRISSL